MPLARNDLLCPIALMRSHRDQKYLDFIRAQPCCITGFRDTVIAHHVKLYGGGGAGLKPSDYLTVPLRHDMHQELHDRGEPSFWLKYNLSPGSVIEKHLVQCVQPGTNLEEIFKSPTAIMVGDGRLRALIEAVATWRLPR